MIVGVLATALVPGIVAPASADGSQGVRTESGRVRCLIEVDDVGHGGGPVVACQTSFPGNRGFPQAAAAPSPGFNTTSLP
jgi:hypothetical protein